eukprot:EG_transcript_8298
MFRNPMLLTTDTEGNLFIADAGNARIRKLSSDGTVSTVAGSGQMGWRDGPAAEAQFRFLSSVSVDPRPGGTLLVADHMSHCLRAMDAAGMVSTLAGVPGESGYCDGPARTARFMQLSFMQAGPKGDIFVLDRGNHCIRRIDPDALLVSTFAGNGRPGLQDGVGSQAQFHFPSQCAMDADGNMWVTDTGNNAIRHVHPDGAVVTVAGNGTPGYADGEGAEAQFDRPAGIVLDGNGNLLVADMGNDCVRLVTPAGFVSTLLAPGGDPEARAGPQGLCPCRQPVGLALTDCCELVISDFRRHAIYIVPAGVPPHRPVRDAPARPISVGGDRTAALWSAFAATKHAAPALQAKSTNAAPDPLVTSGAGWGDVKAYLLFAHSSEISSPEHIIGLMDLCRQFGRDDGVQRCLQYCRRHVCPTNAIQWLVEGHRRGLADLTLWLQQYVRQNWDAIRKTAPLSFNLMQPYPELLELTIPDHMRLNRWPLPAPRRLRG